MVLNNMPDQNKGSEIKSVTTALNILEVLKEHNGLRLTDVMEELNLAKTTAHRYLTTLEQNNYLIRQDSEYKISGRFIHYAEQVYNREPAYSMIGTKVENLAEETDELVQFLIEEHHRIVYVFNEIGKQGIQIDTRAGQYGHLHSTAGGKAILSEWSHEAVEQFCDDTDLPQITEHTITDPDELKAELNEVRDAGYAVNDEENIVGVRAVAVPINGPNGEVIGGISISGPINRIQGEVFRKELPDRLRGASNELEVNIRFH